MEGPGAQIEKPLYPAIADSRLIGKSRISFHLGFQTKQNTNQKTLKR